LFGRDVGAEADGVEGGDLQAVEEAGGVLDVEATGGEGVDDLGDGDLDGLAVLERKEFDVAAGDKVSAADDVEAVGSVELLQAAVEVAEGRSGDGDSAALEPVGFDVAADVDLHGSLLWGYPPGGTG